MIDTHNGTTQAITHNPDDGMFRSEILNGTDQLGVYFNVEALTTKHGDSLKEELESMTENLDGEDDPLSVETSSILKNAFNSWAKLIEQVQFASATLRVRETDVQLKPFLKFKTDSEFMKDFKKVSNKLPDIGELPNLSIMNGAFQGVPKLLVEVSTFWFDIFPKDTPEQQKQAHLLFQEAKAFYESLADRWSFSMNFEDSILPNYLFIFELKDQQNTKTFMDGHFLEKLHDHYQAYACKSIIHNGVEIKSYVFPNFKEVFVNKSPEASELVPHEWYWYYAFTDGQLFWATGTSPDSIKMALDRKAGMGDKFASNPSYQKLVESLQTDNNVLLAFSPIIAIKTFMPLLRKTDPNSTISTQILLGMFTNLPDSYSVGLSAKVQNNGIDSNIFLALGDFKQLIQMFGMLFGTGQM